MLSLINKLILLTSSNGQYGMNSNTLITTVLLMLTIEAVSISAESLNISATSPAVKSKSCCSFKNFKCDTETSPSEIECSETEHAVLLIPYKYPEDKYTLTREFDGINSSMSSIRLLTSSRNYTEPEFCIGWRTEGSTIHEAALVCYDQINFLDNVDDNDGLDFFVISGICLLCSVFFAFITLVIYFLLPWLRDIQGKIIISLLISICIGYSILAYIQLFNDITENVCVLTGFMVYYWCFATFTWLHISCFNIWRTVVLSRNQFTIFKKPKLLFGSYSLFAWGIPALFLIAALVLEYVDTNNFYHIRPRMGESRCWFHTRSAVWTFFYGPLMIIILSNILYFISVVNRLHKLQKVELKREAITTGNTDVTKTNEITNRSIHQVKKLNKMMYKNKLYLKLFFAMGVTFIFEILSDLYLYNLPHTIILRIIFQIMDIINALQGLILFIVLILTRKKVLKALFKKLKIPTSYLPFKNENNDGEEDDEEDENEDEGFSTDDDEQQLTSNRSSRQHNPSKITEEIQMA